MDDQKERIKFMKKYFALLLTIMMAFTACSASPAVDSSGLESLSQSTSSSLGGEYCRFFRNLPRGYPRRRSLAGRSA